MRPTPKAPPEFSLGVQGGTRPSAGEAMSHTLEGEGLTRPPESRGITMRWGDDTGVGHPAPIPSQMTDARVLQKKNGNLQCGFGSHRMESGKAPWTSAGGPA